jgi:hypothetical protein
MANLTNLVQLAAPVFNASWEGNLVNWLGGPGGAKDGLRGSGVFRNTGGVGSGSAILMSSLPVVLDSTDLSNATLKDLEKCSQRFTGGVGETKARVNPPPINPSRCALALAFSRAALNFSGKGGGSNTLESSEVRASSAANLNLSGNGQGAIAIAPALALAVAAANLNFSGKGGGPNTLTSANGGASRVADFDLFCKRGINDIAPDLALATSAANLNFSSKGGGPNLLAWANGGASTGADPNFSGSRMGPDKLAPAAAFAIAVANLN